MFSLWAGNEREVQVEPQERQVLAASIVAKDSATHQVFQPLQEVHPPGWW